MDDFKEALEKLIEEAIAAGISQEEIDAALNEKVAPVADTASGVPEAEPGTVYEAGVNAPESGAPPEQGEAEPPAGTAA